MKIFELRCERQLKYYSSKVEGNLDLSFIKDSEELTVISCAELTNYKEKEVAYINATSRVKLAVRNDLFFYNVRSFSPFYSTIFWDLAHSLDVGKKIYVFEESGAECIYKSEYYKGSFECLEENGLFSVFLKKEKLLCESSKGLESWTFGIPVGPEEPTFLNYTVKRLLELKIHDLEIILCGQPHENFEYFDKVKIIGTDIPAPPVHITRKKNAIAKAATKENLCIFHDRVLLPLNFKEAMVKFGDNFPLTGMQSVYFTDYYNFVPRRYSDFNTLNKPLNKYIDIDNYSKKDIKATTSNFEFLYQHPKRMSFGKDYLTGSLYICKTRLWDLCPQNEKLFWDDFEDVEHGARIARMGIPVIINPFSLTQSMNARSIIHYYGYMNAITENGKKKLLRSITEIIPFIRKKPLFRITESQAKRKMINFIDKYCNDENIAQQLLNVKLTGYTRLLIASKIINDVQIPVWEIKGFVKDFNSNILFESMPPEQQIELEKFLNSGVSANDKKNALITSPFLHNQLSHSLFHSSFSVSKYSWCVKKGLLYKIGSLFSAYYLKYLHKGFYLPLTIKEIKRILIDTSMFKQD